MTHHKLSKAQLLDYALQGARTELSVAYERLTEEERDVYRADQAEIRRRIKLVEIAEARKEKQP